MKLRVSGLVAMSAMILFYGHHRASAVQEPDDNSATFQVHSNLVLVPVTVTTGNGRAVPALEKEHFTVFEDHKQQVITHFTSEDAPATIGFVIDASDSMLPRMGKAREAVYAILQNANPDDDFFLIRFSNHADMLVPLTNHPDEIRRGVDAVRVDGSTAVLDAVAMGLREMRHSRHTRRALILISDGEDNSSRITDREFKRMTCENDTPIYTLFVGDPVDFSQFQHWNKYSGAGLLDDIAKQTGGRMFTVTKIKQLPEIAAKIGTWLRSQYVLGYVPEDASRDGRYHKIQVKIARPDGAPRIHANWRLGYIAPKD
jgi:VWFA-related protein